jgi:uncharacterized membrane protein SpoIIM required for sporulation
MIIDLPRFVQKSRDRWTELETLLDRIDRDGSGRLSMQDALRLHYLYQRVSADLAEIRTFAAEPRLQTYLGSLVARAYQEIHETRGRGRRFRVRYFLGDVFPRTFRKHLNAFWLACGVMVAGGCFGAFATSADPLAKRALVPEQFAHLLEDPSKRVAEEESGEVLEVGGAQAAFSTMLMTHNIRVSIFEMALGMTWGIGTLILLFYNGIILGLVAADFILAGETLFLMGWLLPHGAIELPAVLIGGQAGFILAGALIGRGDARPVRERLRGALPDICVLVGGLACLLVWAGIVEAFISQYHHPVLPYWLKITFGVAELALLIFWLLVKRGRAE